MGRIRTARSHADRILMARPALEGRTMLHDQAIAPHVAAETLAPPAATAAETIPAVAVTPVAAATAGITKRILNPIIWRIASRTLRRPWHLRNRQKVKSPAIWEAAIAL